MHSLKEIGSLSDARAVCIVCAGVAMRTGKFEVAKLWMDIGGAILDQRADLLRSYFKKLQSQMHMAG